MTAARCPRVSYSTGENNWLIFTLTGGTPGHNVDVHAVPNQGANLLGQGTFDGEGKVTIQTEVTMPIGSTHLFANDATDKVLIAMLELRENGSTVQCTACYPGARLIDPPGLCNVPVVDSACTPNCESCSDQYATELVCTEVTAPAGTVDCVLTGATPDTSVALWVGGVFHSDAEVDTGLVASDGTFQFERFDETEFANALYFVMGANESTIATSLDARECTQCMPGYRRSPFGQCFQD